MHSMHTQSPEPDKTFTKGRLVGRASHAAELEGELAGRFSIHVMANRDEFIIRNNLLFLSAAEKLHPRQTANPSCVPQTFVG